MAKTKKSEATAKRIDALQRCIKSCQETAGRLDALKECEIDCDREIRENATQLRVAEKMLKHLEANAE